MYVLKTFVPLDAKHKEALRKEFKERTGEDCLVLDNGFELQHIPTRKEQPLLKRLFG